MRACLRERDSALCSPEVGGSAGVAAEAADCGRLVVLSPVEANRGEVTDAARRQAVGEGGGGGTGT